MSIEKQCPSENPALKTGMIQGQSKTSQGRRMKKEHVTNNKAVRNTLIERGIRPETLPPAEDAKKVERRIASQQKKALSEPGRFNSDSD